MKHTICIFGDSITWGAFDDQNGGWAQQFKQYFGKNRNNTIYTLGIPGDTSTNLIKRIKPEIKFRSPDVIIIAIGINDSQYFITKKFPKTSKIKFKNNINKLIKICQKFTPKIIFIGLTKVDESKVMPRSKKWKNYRDNQTIEEYNNIIKEECHTQNVSFINTFNSIGIDNLADGLHPNSDGHSKLFSTIKKFIMDNNILEIK